MTVDITTAIYAVPESAIPWRYLAAAWRASHDGDPDVWRDATRALRAAARLAELREMVGCIDADILAGDEVLRLLVEEIRDPDDGRRARA